VIPLEARAAFLRRIHLFHDLQEEDLGAIAAQLDEQVHSRGQKIFEEGETAERFFIIQHGTVAITHREGGRQEQLATLVDGDYFGEESLVVSRLRGTTAEVVEDSSLFSITREQFANLIKRFPRLKKALEISIGSRRLARQLHFDWLGPDEVIYFLARKHEVVLGQALGLPIIALAAPAALLAYFFLTRSFFSILGAGILLVLIIAWAVWNWIDWGNDYYIVTNHRVIWLEKVIGLYDSRQEAPLSTILSVGVETDVTGRMLDYGNVIVRTYVGKIVFGHVAHPFQAGHLIEEHWSRSKRSASRREKEAMRDVLRRKMGLPVDLRTDQIPTIDQTVTPSLYRRSMLQAIISRWFKLRVEDGGTITYRKHWFVLWQQVWQPTVLLVLIVFGMIARLVTLARTPGQRLFDASKVPPVDTTMLALPLLLLPIILWWIYQYLDWRNDIFVVTPDQLLDIDKKPFGSEMRRAAPLENILSTEAERVGLAGYIFNFGTVYITIGGANLDFQDVLDPTAVQADIDRRRETRVALRREIEAATERERMSDWLIAYHENEAELRRLPRSDEGDPKSG
jgi:cyclic nucleotide-binding protein